MARKYSQSASKDVEREMHKFKRGTLKSGKDGKGGKVVHGFVVTPDTPLTLGSAVTIDGARDSNGYLYVVVPDGVPILQFTIRGGVGDVDLDADGGQWVGEGGRAGREAGRRQRHVVGAGARPGGSERGIGRAARGR